jgi:hypothetical protein
LASAFREGRTQRYLPALRLYLFVSLIFFLVLGATNLALIQLVVVASPTKVTWINGQAYVPNPAYDKDDSDTQFMPKMIKLDNAKARSPGGHYSYSTKIYFFAPIGAYHTDLTPEAIQRLHDADVDVDVGDKPPAGKPMTPDQAKKIKAVKVKVKAATRQR